MNDDIKEIKVDVKELIKQGAVHNELLREHERRSMALELSQDKLSGRILPIEKHVNLVNVVLKATGAITVGALIQAAVRLFL